MRRFRLVHVGVVAGLAAASVTAVGVGRMAGATSASSPSSFVPITPCRLLDTRPAPDNVGPRSTPLGPNDTYATAVRGSNGNCVGIPSDATGVSMNVAIVGPTAPSFLTVFPSDANPRPLSASLNWVAGQAPTPNAVTSALSGDGKVSFYNLAGTVNLAVDVVGYYEPSTSGPAGPAGPTGPAGPVNRIPRAQIAALRWNQDPGRPATITVGTKPRGVASDGTDVWVANDGSGTVSKIDPTTDAIVATVDLGGFPDSVAFDGASIWVSSGGVNTVSRIDPGTNAVTATVTGFTSPQGIAVDGSGNIWVANHLANTVSEINPSTNTISATVTGISGPWGLAFDGTYVWVSFASNGVERFNPSTRSVSGLLSVGNFPEGMAFDGTNLWVVCDGPGNVYKIDPVAPAVETTLVVGIHPRAAVFDGHSIWVTNEGSATVSRIDPTTNLVTSTVTGFTAPEGVAFDGSNVWVTDQDGGVVAKLRF